MWQKFAFREMNSFGTSDCLGRNCESARECMQKGVNHCMSSYQHLLFLKDESLKVKQKVAKVVEQKVPCWDGRSAWF